MYKHTNCGCCLFYNKLLLRSETPCPIDAMIIVGRKIPSKLGQVFSVQYSRILKPRGKLTQAYHRPVTGSCSSIFLGSRTAPALGVCNTIHPRSPGQPSYL